MVSSHLFDGNINSKYYMFLQGNIYENIVSFRTNMYKNLLSYYLTWLCSDMDNHGNVMSVKTFYTVWHRQKQYQVKTSSLIVPKSNE